MSGRLESPCPRCEIAPGPPGVSLASSPPIFEAYARILHQIRPQNEQQQTVRWAERAAEQGRELGTQTSWREVIGTAAFGSQPGERLPEIGTLTGEEVGRRLVSVPDQSQGRDACWFGLWSGWGFLTSGGHAELRPKGSWFSALRDRRRAERNDRRLREQRPPSMTFLGDPLLLISGTVSDVLRFRFHGPYQSPTVWWPDDRSWFVHTNFDAMSTFVGGRRAAIQRLVGEQILESFEVGLDDRAIP